MWSFLLLLAVDSTSRSFPVALAPTESLQVTVAGSGAPVVLLPGLFGSAYGYRNLVPALAAAGYRAIVMEPLGVGESARPDRADYSLVAQADRVARVLDSLDVRGAVVVGHALGAALAYRLAYRRAELVRGIVSLEGGPAEVATTPGFRRAMELAPWLKLLGGVQLIRRKIRGSLIASSGDSSWVTDDVIVGYTAGAARNLDATLRAYLAMSRAREPERLLPNLPAIRCPVRLVIGAVPHDERPRAREIALLARGLPRFAVDTVAGVGHFVHEERPAAVLAAVRRLEEEEA
jgi:pimeloyl-ACP methyl ester carboxylesterase